MSKETGEHPSLKNAFFEILFQGNFPIDAIQTVYTSNSLRQSVASEEFIEGQWQFFQGKKYPNDVNPSRYRFVNAGVENSNLTITLDPCVSYRDFTGSRGPEFRMTFTSDFWPNPTAVGLLLSTSNNQLVVTHRVGLSDYKSGGLNTSAGGFMEILKDSDLNGNANIIAAIHRETREELGINPETELVEMTCIGAVHNPLSTATEIMFSGTTSLATAEVIKRINDGENKVYVVENSPHGVADQLKNLNHAWVATGLAYLVVHGANQFGTEWLLEISEALDRHGKNYFNPQFRERAEKWHTRRVQRRTGRSNLLATEVLSQLIPPFIT